MKPKIKHKRGYTICFDVNNMLFESINYYNKKIYSNDFIRVSIDLFLIKDLNKEIYIYLKKQFKG